MSTLEMILPAPPCACQERLFKATELQRQLASAETPLLCFRNMLKQGDAALKQLFDEGVPVQELVPARAWLIDELLRQVWALFSAMTPRSWPSWRWEVMAGASCIRGPTSTS